MTEQSQEPTYEIDTRPLCQGMPFVLTDAAHPRIVLKHGSHFLVMDESANIPACNTLGYGYYRYDTRQLSQWELCLNGAPLSLLSKDTGKGYAGSFLYTNPHTHNLPQQKITISRQIVLSDELWDQMILENYDSSPLSFQIQLKFLSDFADMFEVRGLNRSERGQRMRPFSSQDGKSLYLAYRGLDYSLLETYIEFSGIVPQSLVDGEATFDITLPVRQPVELTTRIITRWDGAVVGGNANQTTYHMAMASADERFDLWRQATAKIATDNELLDVTLERALRDIYILRQPTPKGFALAAGIPWYCAVFGRDSAITAWQVLPFMPELARECIEVLAAYQGSSKDTYKAERPGKIMHELRLGELARLKLIPHSPYFGSVDATPLWITLFCEYLHWTGDLEFAQTLWPRIKHALAWLDEATADGYLTYKRESPQGLENQGWKDSGDSVMHKDGSLAEPPIAICEAQSYLYGARRSIAWVAKCLGYETFSQEQEEKALKLKERFNRDFWIEDQEFVAMALDKNGRKTEVISSNAGHCLWTGILDDDRAHVIADRLMRQDMDSGWGIRTLSADCNSYNPISYHNGSIWPHDNAMMAEGMRRLGRLADIWKLMSDVFDAAQSNPDFRLPELYCGFPRETRGKPVDYPVSCSPQAWAAGSIFQFVGTCLNFHPDALNEKLSIINPALPPWLERVIVRNLRIGGASVDLAFHNHDGSTFCQILKKSGRIKIVIES